jgi:hypothetical protein
MDMKRVGNLLSKVEIKWEVISEDAIEGEHFSVDITSLIFEYNESVKSIPINIVDDNEKNPDRHFTVKLVECNVLQGDKIKGIIGDKKCKRITILDDDIPG